MGLDAAMTYRVGAQGGAVPCNLHTYLSELTPGFPISTDNGIKFTRVY